MTAKLYRTARGATLEIDRQCFELADLDFDEIFRRENPLQWLLQQKTSRRAPETALSPADLLAPIVGQEVWAAGVTYYRSRSARMEESADAGGGDFYDRVYSAERPELFYKAAAHRVAGHRREVCIRADSQWNVPEPELTACISAAGGIFGYTIGNDMSSRDIEGENPLYLPQAKVYDGCCALGPCILLSDDPLPESTEISLQIRRGGAEVFAGSTQLSQMKRKAPELAGYLFRQNSFPAGCFLLTGTGVVPPSDFTLRAGDEIRITIEPIGTLQNKVA